MHSSGLAAVAAIAALIVYKVLTTVVENRRHAAEAKRLGCLPPPEKVWKYPFGIDGVLRAIKADKDKLFPNMLEDIYHEMGHATVWASNQAGSRAFMTVDPKVIQAVLATQFNDFELGPIRAGSMGPLFGNGIFTSDGKGWFVPSKGLDAVHG